MVISTTVVGYRGGAGGSARVYLAGVVPVHHVIVILFFKCKVISHLLVVVVCRFIWIVSPISDESLLLISISSIQRLSVLYHSSGTVD